MCKKIGQDEENKIEIEGIHADLNQCHNSNHIEFFPSRF